MIWSLLSLVSVQRPVPWVTWVSPRSSTPHSKWAGVSPARRMEFLQVRSLLSQNVAEKTMIISPESFPVSAAHVALKVLLYYFTVYFIWIMQIIVSLLKTQSTIYSPKFCTVRKRRAFYQQNIVQTSFCYVMSNKYKTHSLIQITQQTKSCLPRDAIKTTFTADGRVPEHNCQTKLRTLAFGDILFLISLSSSCLSEDSVFVIWCSYIYCATTAHFSLGINLNECHRYCLVSISPH